MMQNSDIKPPKIVTHAQYLKDLSFESPNVPMSLSPDNQPKLDLKVDIQVDGSEEGLYEVNLIINLDASHQDTKMMLIEVKYAGLFSVSPEPGEALDKLLLVDCSTLLFPYVRRIISNLSQDGSFLPIWIAPIDFAELYSRHKAQEQQTT